MWTQPELLSSSSDNAPSLMMINIICDSCLILLALSSSETGWDNSHDVWYLSKILVWMRPLNDLANAAWVKRMLITENPVQKFMGFIQIGAMGGRVKPSL